MDITSGQSVEAREDEGVTIHVKNAFGEKEFEDGKPVTVTVVGTYSKRYREISEKNSDRIWKRAAQLEAEDMRKQSVETVAGCILGWEGFTANGQPFPFNKTNAVVLLQSCPWIREQVEKAMTDHAGFFAQS